MIKINVDLAALKSIQKKIKGRHRAFAIEFIQDLNEAVVGNPGHPVITGFLRGSWHAAIGGSASGGGTLDPSGQGALARMNLVAASIQTGDVYHANNSASYAGHVEVRRAFVSGPLSAWRSIAKAAAAKVKSL